MSIEAMTWVLRHSEAKLGARLVLLALADYAHADGSEAYPSVATLANNTRMSKRAVQFALKSLKDDGSIVPDGDGRNGTVCYRLLLGGANSARGEESDVQGVKNPSSGGEAASPNPSKEPVLTTTQKKERARERAQSIPDSFPEILRPHLLRVLPVLSDVAVQHNAREVTPRGVALAIEGAPGRRYVAVAYELASWAQSGRVVKDVVATYRTFLSKADIAAGVESLDAPQPTPQRGQRNGTNWTGRDVLEFMGVGNDD